MTGLNVLKKIWVKIWGEDIPPQQEVFENKNANLFKSFYTKIRNKLVFRRLAIVLFLLIATCLTFNYLKYTKFFACLGKDVCIYRGPKHISPRTSECRYLQLGDGNIIGLAHAHPSYNYNYHKLASLLTLLGPKDPLSDIGKIPYTKYEKRKEVFRNYYNLINNKLVNIFGKGNRPSSEIYIANENRFHPTIEPVFPLGAREAKETTNSSSELIFYNIGISPDPHCFNIWKCPPEIGPNRIIYNYKTQTQKSVPDKIFNKIYNSILYTLKVNNNTNLHIVLYQNSSKLYRHDTDKWTLTEVPNNLDLELDFLHYYKLYDGNIIIPAKHRNKTCINTKICEPAVLYDVNSNRFIITDVEFKDFEDYSLHLKTKNFEHFILPGFEKDNIVYDSKNLKLMYEENIMKDRNYNHYKSLSDDFTEIDKLLRKYTNVGINDYPNAFEISENKFLIWSTNQGFPNSKELIQGIKYPKEQKRTVFYDSEKHIVKRGPDFINSPLDSNKFKLNENKSIFIGGNEDLFGSPASKYMRAVPPLYTQIIEVKE